MLTLLLLLLLLLLSLLCPFSSKQPDAWPATFGSLAEYYSLRRFWR